MISANNSWEQREAKELCSITTGKSNTQDQVEDGKYIFFIRSDVPVRSNRYLFDEEAVITIGDGNIGRVFHYVNGKFDLHQRCYKMSDFRYLTAKYFYYFFSTKFYDRAMSMTAKATVDSVRLEMISDMDIRYPKEFNEQNKISAFLNNVDSLITLHQREQIYKINGVKTKITLFIYSWEQRELGSEGTTFTGLSGKTKDDFGHGEGSFVTYMNVFKNPIADPQMVEPIDIDNSQREIKYGDIFFTTSSETPDEVGMSSIWQEKASNTYLNSFCFGYRLNNLNKYDLNFLAYNFRADSFRKDMVLLAQGISRYNISKNKVMEIQTAIPKDKEEQIKIGRFLVDVDSLITLHQREQSP